MLLWGPCIYTLTERTSRDFNNLSKKGGNMIKPTQEGKEITKYPLYPLLAKHTHSDFTVLFWKNAHGIIIQSNCDYYPVGYVSTQWNDKMFSPIKHKITLENI